jgi:hypothetical protein
MILRGSGISVIAGVRMRGLQGSADGHEEEKRRRQESEERYSSPAGPSPKLGSRIAALAHERSLPERQQGQLICINLVPAVSRW